MTGEFALKIWAEAQRTHRNGFRIEGQGCMLQVELSSISSILGIWVLKLGYSSFVKIYISLESYVKRPKYQVPYKTFFE